MKIKIQFFLSKTKQCACMPCVHAKSLQSCPTLCHKMNCSPPGCSVYGILQARVLEWVVILFCRGSSQPGIEPGLARGFFTTSATWEAQNMTRTYQELEEISGVSSFISYSPLAKTRFF